MVRVCNTKTDPIPHGYDDSWWNGSSDRKRAGATSSEKASKTKAPMHEREGM